MSSQPNRNQKSGSQSNSAIVATIAAVGLGAVAAVGAYFMGKAVGEEEAVKNTTRTSPSHRHDLASWTAQDNVKPGGDGDDKDGDAEECLICFRSYDEVKRLNEEIHTTPCGHVYCEKCINTCLEIKAECPKCKRPVRVGQTLRIFL